MAASEKEGLPVGQIADAVRIGQPATSTYLAQLQNECGLVACTRAGRYCLYRAEPDAADAKSVALFQALKRFFRTETTGWAFANGARPPAPAFLAVLPALANAMRVQLLRFVRDEKRTDRVKVIAATGFSDINVRRHLACLASCGLVENEGEDVFWREPADALSRLFIELSLS